MNHPLQKRAYAFIREHGLIEPGDHVLAAVSGGPDSTALLHILISLKPLLRIGQLTVIHFNHGLRGEESDGDMAFAGLLAKMWDLPFVSGKENVHRYREGRHVSLEMAARDRRHLFFRDALTRCSAQRLALGHTASDQAEELLLRLLRGTGPSGLGGMLPATGQSIVRPLLFATREEILDYLSAQNLACREDSSNLQPFTQRNALRLEVFPLLRKYFHPDVARTLARHADLAREEDSWWADRINESRPSVYIEQSPGRIVMDIGVLSGLHPALRRRMLRDAIRTLRGDLMGISAAHILALDGIAMKTEPGRSVHLPGGLRGITENGRLLLLPGAESPENPSTLFEQTIPGPGIYDWPLFSANSDRQGPARIEIRIQDCGTPAAADFHATTPDVAWLDADKVSWPMMLRTWKPGDRFRPLGLSGSKKLQDFFTDAKVPRAERGRIPLLCDGEKICWVVGHRLDDRVKTTPETRRVAVVRAF